MQACMVGCLLTATAGEKFAKVWMTEGDPSLHPSLAVTDWTGVFLLVRHLVAFLVP